MKVGCVLDGSNVVTASGLLLVRPHADNPADNEATFQVHVGVFNNMPQNVFQ